MSSQEELIFVVGRGLRLLEIMLDIVRRSRSAPISCREQMRTAGNR
jgi:hypothetical protein